MHVHCSGLLETVLPMLVELCLVDVFEMAWQILVTQRVETNWLLLWSPGTELFTLVELFLGVVLEMERHWWRLCTVTVDSFHCLEMYVFVCNLTKCPYYRVNPNDYC